jgi:outer membrane scaffolding protein for murein synthesis (MipA/OmpV family)
MTLCPSVAFATPVRTRLALIGALAGLIGAPAQAQGEAPAPSAPSSAAPATRSAPLWELGVGAAGLSLPDYRGSGQRSGYLLPLPYVVYRGRFLRADREGARAVLLDTDRFEVNLSLNAGPPAHSRAGGARAGMANLPGSFELGPKIQATLWRGAGGSRLNLDLPLRAVYSIAGSPQRLGTVFVPNLDLGLATGTPWRLGLQAGALWGSRGLHQHYYGVSAADAVNTPALQRPAYEARGGYGGWLATAALSRRFDRTWVGGFVRHDHVGGAVFADSPLVRKTSHWSAGIGMVWVFAASDEQVSRDD